MQVQVQKPNPQPMAGQPPAFVNRQGYPQPSNVVYGQVQQARAIGLQNAPVTMQQVSQPYQQVPMVSAVQVRTQPMIHQPQIFNQYNATPMPTIQTIQTQIQPINSLARRQVGVNESQ